MNNFESNWLIFFITIEFFIVLFFIVSCYVAKLYFIIRSKRHNRILGELQDTLQKNQYPPKQLLKHIDLVLQVFRSLDEKPVSDWDKKRTTIVRDELLPDIRHYINNRSWEKRYLLVLCFDYYIEQPDYDLLIRLINDKSAIVSFNAMRIASKLGARKLLKAILSHLQRAPHPFDAFAIHSFFDSPEWHNVIQEELKTSADPWLKKICYEILLKIGTESAYFELAAADCYHDNINVRLAAIRILPYTDRTRYLELYKKLIKDENWMVRNAVVKTLKYIQDPDALELLTNSLKDPQWWVRANAAKALAYYGDSGQLLLAEYKAEKLTGFEEAAYFLKIQKIRKTNNHG